MTKLAKNEKKIENALLKGEFRDVGRPEFEHIAESLAARKKDSVLNIRVNSEDLKNIKKKAKKYGIRYQSLIAEWIHRVAS